MFAHFPYYYFQNHHNPPQNFIFFINFILDMAEVLRDFQCKLCSKLLGSRAALQRHSKEVHSRNSTVVSCPRCQKLFQNRSNLKIHMLTHSGVRPFKYVSLFSRPNKAYCIPKILSEYNHSCCFYLLLQMFGARVQCRFHHEAMSSIPLQEGAQLYTGANA